MKKEQLQQIIEKMTLHEKVMFVTGKNSWRTRDYEHLGIPSILMSDGTAGVRFQIGSDNPQEMSFYDSLGGSFDSEDALSRTVRATCFPSGSAIACSWDKELLTQIGKALAKECREQGINMLLGPGMNIHRHPLTARNFEYYSEDPVITGEMGSAVITGVQSEGVGTCMKHFACHNSDSRRTRVNVKVSERALREIYLAGYERVVQKAHPTSLMSAYNQVNGEETSGDNRLTRDIVKGEWGFDGAVICDWGATKDPVAATLGEIDLQMPLAKSSAAYLEKAVQSGELDEKLLDKRVERILDLVFKLKEWEKNWTEDAPEDHHALAVKAAEESMVLLKNENGILPLKKNNTIAVIGDMAVSPLYQGTGCAVVHAKTVDIPLEEMTPYMNSFMYAQGCRKDGTTDEDMLKAAVDCAASADQVVVFVGSFLPSEDDDYNRKSIRLLPGMEQLIEAVAKANSHVVVVAAGGEVLEMPWRHMVDGILLTWFTGEGMGKALARILFGDVCPSGRLANTIPERLGDTPAYVSFDGNEFELAYAEDIYVGYRYYDKKGIDPAYPFGYGLSYTQFEYSDIQVTDEQSGKGKVTVTANITNTGDVTGTETVQLYIAPACKTRLPRPVRELKNYTRVALMPGETKTVTMELDARDFACYDPKAQDWVVDAGEYLVELAHSSRDIRLHTAVKRAASGKRIPLSYDCGFYELFADPTAKKMFYEFMVEQGVVTADQVDEKLERGIVWSFWSVRSYLDMNTNGMVSFEAFNAFIDKVNARLGQLR